MGIEIHRAPDRDVRRDDAPAAPRPMVLPAPLHAIEEELEVPGEVDVAQLHAELAGLRDFSGVVHRGGRVFATFANTPSRGAVGLATERAKAHRGRVR